MLQPAGKFVNSLVSAVFTSWICVSRTRGGSQGLHDVPWGSGDSRAAEMLRVLKAKGFKGPIAIEYEWKWDIPTLLQCVAFFHEQANKLAAE